MSEPPEDWPGSKELWELIEAWRSEGVPEEEITERLRRAADLKGAEEFGLIERVTLADGSALLYDRDPFERLPVSEEDP
jgi:hypothetical protein